MKYLKQRKKRLFLSFSLTILGMCFPFYKGDYVAFGFPVQSLNYYGGISIALNIFALCLNILFFYITLSLVNKFIISRVKV
ncbi:hypothetical protein BN000_03095 [Neobacillus massiliamazoniensis]|jgi:hypothetical protein|uniref:Uncharacterized protein n=1 Tax=Neobacillus massiliamazoniensis TaxID=1499688 RepID=A0A0U1NYS8_9BACI|nr:hypothetical protein BN000_03095 [Neobacillus massiliamazoniensis]